MSGWVPLGYWDTQVAGLGRMVRKQNPNTFVMSSSLPRRKGNSALWPEDFQVPSRLGPEITAIEILCAAPWGVVHHPFLTSSWAPQFLWILETHTLHVRTQNLLSHEYLYLAALDLHCCTQVFSVVAVSGNYFLVEVHGMSL